MPRARPIPLTVVVGPLGAGKTTLINRLLSDPSFADTAMILNEFGRTELRNALVEKAEDGIIPLGGGCVCCAVRSELVEALERLIRDLDNRRIANIGRAIVEGTAATDPAAVYACVALHPYLSLRFKPNGIVAVLGPDRPADLTEDSAVLRQIAMADVIATTGLGADILSFVARINPFATIVDASAAGPAVFTGYGPFDPAEGDAGRWLGTAVDTADIAGIRAFTVERQRRMPFPALERFVDFLVALQGANLIRVRGIVAAGEGGSIVVEGLGGLFWPLQMTEEDLIDDRTRFAVVAHGLDRQGFATCLDTFLNEARIDTPDRQAVTDNPLAIAGFTAPRRP